ncbi:MAG TPA: hypothetical protein QKA08_05635 [Candidatus Megaira endosymbiont of Nemacystus decipiens]|nr:hypothetical protein [Candidatus Megaera endosymbiont of Nemacystus decipiens]
MKVNPLVRTAAGGAVFGGILYYYNNNRDLYDAFNASSAVASSNSFELKEIRHELDLRKARSRKELETAKDELENTKYIYHVRWGNNKLGSDLQDLKEDINRIADDNYYQYRYSPSPFTHGLLSSHSYQDSTPGEKVLFKEGMAVTLCDEVEEIQTKEEDKGWVDKILSIPSKMTGWFSKSKSEEEFGHVNSKEPPHPNLKYNEYLEGWQVQEVFKPEGADDYYGVLYVNNEKGYAVLAHRGTAIDDSLKLKNQSLKADLIEILNGNIGVQQMHCNEATHKVVNLVKPYNYHLSTTGHSLGAWLAELSVYYCHQQDGMKQKNVKAITFDSPGTKNQFENLDPNNDKQDFNDTHNMYITTYLSAPNIVNSCNEHVECTDYTLIYHTHLF